MYTSEFMNIAYFGKDIKNLSQKGQKSLDSIFELLENIESKKISDNEYRWDFWVYTSRGTYKDYNKLYPNEKITQNEFLQHNPNEYEWYPFTAVRYEKVKYLILQSLTISNFDNRFEKEQFLEDYDYQMNAVKEVIENVVNMLKKGTYNSFVKENLPYDLRHGVISRKEYFDALPEEKNKIYNELTKEDINKFINYIKEESEYQMPKEIIKDMTFNKYFNMAIQCYKATGKNIYGDTPFRQFQCLGEDFGIFNFEGIDLDSCEDFDKFYEGEIEHMGGHPWGIKMGSSRTRIMLYPTKNGEGYYFRFGANHNWMFYETIKYYITLKEEGCPVIFPCGDEVLEYIEGKDLIGFVPSYEFPAYCQSDFKEKVNDFRHYDEKEHGKIFNKIKWYDIEEIKLKEE